MNRDRNSKGTLENAEPYIEANNNWGLTAKENTGMSNRDAAIFKILALPLFALLVVFLAGERMNWLKVPSLLAIGWGGALLVAIGLMAKAAQGERKRLLKIFVPGLYVTIISVLGISAIHAVLATFLVYRAGVAPNGAPLMITTVAAGIVGLTAIVLFIVLSRGLLLTLRRAKTQVVGKVVTTATCPGLWKYVEDLATKLGALAPDQVIVGLTPNFFRH